MPKKYSDDFHDNAILMVLDHYRDEGGPKINSILVVANSLGQSTETLRMWVSRDQPGAPTGIGESQEGEHKPLRRENDELRRADEIWKKSQLFSQPSQTAPQRNDPVHRRTP